MFKANFNTMSKYILQFWVIFMVASCTICCEFRVCQMHSNIWCCWWMYVEDDSNENDNDNEVEKTLAIIIGIIAAVALIIVFVSFLNKLCDTGKGTYIYITILLISLFSLLFFFLVWQSVLCITLNLNI